MLGLVYALPYVDPSLSRVTGGFVLVDTAESAQPGGANTETVLGYVLFTTDTRTFEHLADIHYWPTLREKYPVSTPASILDDTDADRRFFDLIHNTDTKWIAQDSAIAFSPAHLHIDLLPEAQRQGWGRRLIRSVVDFFRDLNANPGQEHVRGIWVGLDQRNVEAPKFYNKLGFRPIEGAPATLLGLDFKNWA